MSSDAQDSPDDAGDLEELLAGMLGMATGPSQAAEDLGTTESSTERPREFLDPAGSAEALADVYALARELAEVLETLPDLERAGNRLADVLKKAEELEELEGEQ